VSSFTVPTGPVSAEPTSAEIAAQTAAANGLVELGGRPPLRVYIKELWTRRYFAFELARSRFRAQNEADRLGAAWVILTPLINAAVYGFVFGILLPSKSRPPHFLPFLVVGVFTFAFFSGCFADGAKSIIGNRGLVRTLHFPRAVLPVASVLQKLLELSAMVVVMCVIVLLSGEPISLRWLRIFPAFFLMALFCSGISFFAARLTIHIRDIAQLIPFITRLIFYVSGIFFAVGHKFSGRGNLTLLLQGNPLNVYITLIRDSILTRDRIVNGQPADGIAANIHTWEMAAAWGVVLFVTGFIFFWRAEGLYGRD
jgi:teichoic acid transport system permease protein